MRGHLDYVPAWGELAQPRGSDYPNPYRGKSRGGSKVSDGVFRMRGIGAILGRRRVTSEEVECEDAWERGGI